VVSAIQIKNVPPEIHERLRERARRDGRNLSEYALEVLARDLAVPNTREWLERLRQDEPVGGVRANDVADLIHEGRAERDERILRALSSGD
jgi:plasmid stability protein